MLYCCVYIVISFLLLLIRAMAALRLTVPALYALLVPILFPDWYYTHEALGDGIFFVLLGIVALSWIVTIVRKVRELF